MTATYPPRADVRQCRLYRFYVTDPFTGGTVLGYIGETGRQPFERLLEHLATQPWFDTVVRWEIDPQVYYGKKAVLDAETAAIRAERPLYNVVGNERNEKRIIPPVAIRQRRARDAQAQEPRWIHPDDRAAQPRAYRASPVRQRPAALTRAQKFAIGWGISWLGSTITAWLLALHWHLGSVEQAGIGSALVLPALLLTVWLLLLWNAGKRRRRKIWRFLTGRTR